MQLELTDVGLYSAAVLLVLMLWKNYKESDKLTFSEFALENKALMAAAAVLAWGLWCHYKGDMGSMGFGQSDKLLTEPFWSPPAPPVSV